MRVQKRAQRATGRAAVAATATAMVATATLAGVPADALSAQAGAAVVDGVLAISGTNDADRITIDFTAVDAVVVDLGGGETRRFAAGSFGSAYVALRSGDDELRTVSGGALADVPMTVRAGNGNDVATTGAAVDDVGGDNGEDLLLGGAGTDLLVGGNGDDFVNGGVGTDVEVLGNGDDTAAWNPGEGNDAITGGTGLDTLTFNGSNADEQMSLSANERSAVFLRAQGNIRMDLHEVERLDLATFGGTDTVRVDDLTGTDLTTADIDLAATAGGGDTSDDLVQVLGTAGADVVGVAADAAAVRVSGLAAQTTVLGGEPTDRLLLDTLAGDDQITVDDAARTLLDVRADLGPDQD